MPIIKSATKKMKQDQRRRAQNLRTKRALREATKAFLDKPTFDALRAVQSEVDTAVKKNVLKKNTAARRMARFSRIAKEAGVKIPAPAKKESAKTAARPTTKPAAKPAAKSTTTKTAATKKPVAKKTPARKVTTKK